ncbi:hypothetical protein ACIBHX_47490 [Nonomuraea sp. NPDC050536]|uniref:hypothetical protein n=1 Tax=Nonomuraea sp. NPDC050536 TaxID=3364366 RepID=UPI0037C57D13
MTKVTLSNMSRLRRTPGATALLFLTDRCPVGCGHCSVASRPDSPTITDRPLFREIVSGLAEVEELEVLAITGGEPFAERWGLTHATEAMHKAGIPTVVFTSGHWAGTRRIASWIPGTLRKVATVVLSTDSFHTRKVAEDRLRRAAELILDAGCHLILQIVNERTTTNLSWLPDSVEVNLVAPLPHGRGRQVFSVPAPRPMAAYGPCGLTNSPTIRYDGTVIACCSEPVIMRAAGHDDLRRSVRHRSEIGVALRSLREAPVLRVIGGQGPRALAMLPHLSMAAKAEYLSICHACHAAHEAVGRSSDAARMVVALAGMEGTSA